MKKSLLILLAIILLVSCEIYFVWDILAETDSDIFMPEKAVNMLKDGNSVKSNDKIKFLIFTDAHIGREDSYVTDRIPDLMEVIKDEKNNIDFILNLGDLVDSGNIENEKFLAFLESVKETGIPMLSILGNHERHSPYARSEWDELFDSYDLYGTMGAYTFDDLTIYALDSSRRLYGQTQLEALENGLKDEGYGDNYKLLITHTDNTSGTSLDQTLIIFGTADIAERNRLIKLMTENNAPLMLYGHNHKGNDPVYHSDKAIEYNLASLHTRDVFYEGKGNYYIATLDKETGELTIVDYLSETKEETGTFYTFNMK